MTIEKLLFLHLKKETIKGSLDQSDPSQQIMRCKARLALHYYKYDSIAMSV